jgi:hypothetical protein
VSRKSARNPPPPEVAAPPDSFYAVDPIAFARDRLGFHADPDQSLVLNPAIRRGMLNCCRQWGKSTTLAVLAVWKAIHFPARSS